MPKKRKRKNHEPTVAPGMDDQEELEQDATEKEVARDDYTHVVHLSYDEVGPSRREEER